MLDSGYRAFLHTKTRAVFSRFASVELILTALTSRNPAQVLESLKLDNPALSLSGLSAEDTELMLHRHFIERLSKAIPGGSLVFLLFRALIMEYEIRNVALFLKLGSAQSERWYPLAPGCGFFDEKILSLSNDTALRLLERSEYREACQIWQKTRDTSRLDAALDSVNFQRLQETIDLLPSPDRQRIRLLHTQKTSLMLTLQSLRMQRSYGMDAAEITSILTFPDNAMRSGILSLLATPRFDDLADALPHHSRTMARTLIAHRPELLPRNPDPELGLADLSCLEKIAATIMLIRYRQEYRNYGRGYAPLFCFYFLFKRELQNIMLLLNGIRFGIAPEILRSELVWQGG
ncbi:MAG TPA: V-type ATPase subunit [Spirochaetota bacterium]|nr:V-type ATPase subunit [Spirochaetota bacterium]